MKAVAGATCIEMYLQGAESKEEQSHESRSTKEGGCFPLPALQGSKGTCLVRK
jgi:hypothetical protein